MIFPFDRKYQRSRLDISEKIIKLENTLISTVKGAAMRGMLKIKVIFTKQLPTMFPKASP